MALYRYCLQLLVPYRIKNDDLMLYVVFSPVNAPHSWPNVVAFLVWLVDWHQLAQSYDPFNACYSEHYEGGAEMQDYDFRVRKCVNTIQKWRRKITRYT